MSFFKWFTPGLGVKRWLLLMIAGVAMLGLGIAYFLKESYTKVDLSGEFGHIVYILTLQRLPRWVRGGLFGLLGVSAVIYGLMQLSKSLLRPFMTDGDNVVDILYRQHQL